MATKKPSTKKSAKKTAVVNTAKVTQPVIKKTVTRQVSTRKTTDIFANAPLGALFGEFIGTFMLAAVIIATSGQPIFVLFALVTVVLTVGHLSGAHVNPAITFGAWITRKLTTKRALFYFLAQVLGAMFAFVLLNYLLGAAPAQQSMLGQAAQAPELFKATQVATGKEWYAIVAGVAGLAVFAFAVASALREKKEHIASAFTVGGGLFVGLIVAGQSAILNPAVALSLQAFSVKGEGALGWAIAIHVIAPFVGAAIGFFLYDLFRKDVDQVA